MACAPIYDGSRVIGSITCTRGEDWPSKTVAPETRWCFACRKHMTHTRMVHVPDSPWYEPHGWWKCEQCGKDRTTFPGGL